MKVGSNNPFTLGSDKRIDFDADVYLLDYVAQEIYDLNNPVELSGLDVGTYSGRFYIAVGPAATAGLEAILNAKVGVHVNQDTQELVVRKKQTIDIEKIKVYTVLGQEVKRFTAQNQVEESFALNGLASGVYIVKLKTDKGELSHKIIKN